MSARLLVLVSIVFAILLTAFLPTDTDALVSHSQPARDYDTAVARARLFQRGDSIATTSGRSVLRVHGHRTPRAFVLFHGLTNSPYQFRDLADSIYDAGDNVFVPRLPWHALPGGTQRELARITATALRGVADTSVDIASGLGDTIIVFGLSLGGTMAAWVAQFRSVDHVVIVAPALGVSHVTALLETPLMNLGLRLPNYAHDDPADPLRPDRMPGWCSRGIAQMMALGLAARRRAGDSAPRTSAIRMLVNAHDETVNRTLIDDLVASWRAKGAAVETYELADTLRLPHDVVDPTEPGAKPSVTEPVILALLYGRLDAPQASTRARSRMPDALSSLGRR
jgi:alpha-beta hydrolase superfamily lysophospholipase